MTLTPQYAIATDAKWRTLTSIHTRYRTRRSTFISLAIGVSGAWASTWTDAGAEPYPPPRDTIQSCTPAMSRSKITSWTLSGRH